MSIRIMSNIWAHSKQRGSALLVLLAIADFADENGKAFPSIQTLAQKTRMTERNIQKLISKLRNASELRVEEQAGPYGCNLYHLTKESGADGGVNASSPGVNCGTGGGELRDAGGERRDVKGVNASSPDPSLDPPKDPSKDPQELLLDVPTRRVFPGNLNTPEFQKVWEEWKAYRKAIKEPLTEIAEKRQLAKLSKMGLEKALESIDDSICNNWRGVFQPKPSKANGSGKTKQIEEVIEVKSL